MGRRGASVLGSLGIWRLSEGMLGFFLLGLEFPGGSFVWSGNSLLVVSLDMVCSAIFKSAFNAFTQHLSDSFIWDSKRNLREVHCPM